MFTLLCSSVSWLTFSSMVSRPENRNHRKAIIIIRCCVTYPTLSDPLLLTQGCFLLLKPLFVSCPPVARWLLCIWPLLLQQWLLLWPTKLCSDSLPGDRSSQSHTPLLWYLVHGNDKWQWCNVYMSTCEAKVTKAKSRTASRITVIISYGVKSTGGRVVSIFWATLSHSSL